MMRKKRKLMKSGAILLRAMTSNVRLAGEVVPLGRVGANWVETPLWVMLTWKDSDVS